MVTNISTELKEAKEKNSNSLTYRAQKLLAPSTESIVSSHQVFQENTNIDYVTF